MARRRPRSFFDDPFFLDPFGLFGAAVGREAGWGAPQVRGALGRYRGAGRPRGRSGGASRGGL